MTSETRLNKFLAHALGISRREADTLIEQGRVTVGGQTAILGTHLTPAALVSVDGAPVAAQTRYQYVAFNKPVGYVCSRRAQGDNPTIYDLLPPEYHALKPVGRLDKDSSGLLILTNDGDFAHRMTHPKFAKQKTYEVTLDRDLEPLHQQMISDYGINLEDGRSQFIIEKLDSPTVEPLATSSLRDSAFPVGASQDERQVAASVSLENDGSEKATAQKMKYRITMREGRNRQIRRTFATLGYTVTALHRTHFGPYALGDIEPGAYRLVDIS